jgi:hypothetical protein
MPIIVPDPYKHYPTAWAKWDYLAGSGHDAMAAGFGVPNGDLNRFASRYRVARAFTRVELDGYGSATEEGYTALFRIMLMWSAFEQFLKALGIKQHQSDALVARYSSDPLLRLVRNSDYQARLFTFVRKKAKGKHEERNLDAYLSGASCNPTYLASTLRHIFAHGYLTPNAGGAAPDRVARICTLLYDFHMNVMDAEFRARIEAYASNLAHSPPT